MRLALGWVGFGLLAGLLELGIATGQTAVRGRLSLFGPDRVWLLPLADLALFALPALAYGAAMAVARPLRRPGPLVGWLAAWAGFAALSNAEGIHWGAAALFAAGVGTVAARWVGSRRVRLGRLAAAGTVTVGLLGLGSLAARALVERRAVAALPAPASAEAPNVLLLVLDTVRAWNLGWHGYGRETTPLLDRRVAAATTFGRAMTPSPWTLPAHASFFTGRWPSQLSAGWFRPLNRAAPTLAEALRDAGYATGGFVANYRYAGRATGLARGFVHYDDYPVRWDEALRMSAMVRRVLRRPRLQEWLGKNRILEARDAGQVNDALLRWLPRRGDRPFFAFVNYVDAHSPYLPPPPFDSMFAGGRDPQDRAARYLAGMQRVFGPGPIPAELVVEYLDGYDGALRYLDTEIDRLLAALDAAGVLQNTIVILTSDHGEHFGEHRLVQHGNSLFLPLLHVPLVVSWPGRVPAGLNVTAPVSLRHLAATVLDLAGVPNPGLPGRSLAARWGPDSARVGPDTLVASVDWHANVTRFPPNPLVQGSLRAVAIDSLQLVRRTDGAEALYHLERDYLQVRNLARDGAYGPAVAALRAALAAQLGEDAGPRPSP